MHTHPTSLNTPPTRTKGEEIYSQPRQEFILSRQISLHPQLLLRLQRVGPVAGPGPEQECPREGVEVPVVLRQSAGICPAM